MGLVWLHVALEPGPNVSIVSIVSIGDLVCALLSQQTETIDRLTTFVGCSYPS